MMFFALPAGDPWVERFHAGERALLEECYREHVSAVLAAATRLLSRVDAETVTHEVFCRLLSHEGTRRSFEGGNVRAWLSKMATNAAIDVLRRRKREVAEDVEDAAEPDPSRFDEEVEAKLLVDRFRAERLPGKYRRLFEARFLRQLSQREAAEELGIERSTLAYQEQQVRALLSDFLLGEERR
jgi:RNA polymerase sigma-70 factor, ECF subfamily